jgi:hypothetical protein
MPCLIAQVTVPFEAIDWPSIAYEVVVGDHITKSPAGDFAVSLNLRKEPVSSGLTW